MDSRGQSILGAPQQPEADARKRNAGQLAGLAKAREEIDPGDTESEFSHGSHKRTMRVSESICDVRGVFVGSRKLQCTISQCTRFVHK